MRKEKKTIATWLLAKTDGLSLHLVLSFSPVSESEAAPLRVSTASLTRAYGGSSRTKGIAVEREGFFFLKKELMGQKKKKEGEHGRRVKRLSLH